jgi:hypothetical protein
MHREPMCFDFLVRKANIAQATVPKTAIVHFCIRNESHTFARQEDTAKVVVIKVTKQPSIPGTGGFG